MDLHHLFSGEIIGMLLIFVARIIDVSIGTIRIILISRGYRYLAPVFGFFEVLVWIFAITHVLKSLNSLSSYLVYAAGFATGNYVGMILESVIAIGYQSLRIITTEKIVSLPIVLRNQGYGVTVMKGWGAKGEVTIILTVLPRRKVSEVLETVAMFEPNAFITVEDIKQRYSGFFEKSRGFPDLFGRMIAKKK